ncbi:MAG: hypothetical protein RSC28_00115 [Bacteroidales bacterium]
MTLFSTGYKEYSKTVDYLSISNLEDLKNARKELDLKIAHKEIELNFQYSKLKDALNPINYISNLIIKFTSVENIIKYFYRGFNFVKDTITQYRKNSDSVTTEEN